MLKKLQASDSWKFFSVLGRADRPLALAWWSVLVLRGLLPAGFVIAMGLLVGAVQRGDALSGPLALMGVIFVRFLKWEAALRIRYGARTRNPFT